jgi:hypothetical protein
MFQGNWFSGTIENHVFSSSHKEMEAIGMHSFTKKSCSKIWNANINNLKVLLSKGSITSLGDEETILGGGGGLNINPGTGIYYYYDKDTEIITSGTKTYSEWITLITYHEDRAKGTVSANTENDKIITRVQSSLNGGVKFSFPESTLVPPDANGYSPTGNINVTLKFFKRDWDSEEDQDNRRPGLSTGMNFAGIAQTVAGTPFSMRDTLAQASPDNVGKRVGLSGGGSKNPANTVAAPVDMYYNAAKGKYQSGNRRMLAVLLEDIDPAPLKELGVSEEDLANLKPTNFTDKNLGTFTPYSPTYGKAMPVEAQNNNPHLLTPNFVKKCPNDNVYQAEVVTAVNRWRKAYKKGETVFLTEVGREWIIESQEQTAPVSPLKIGEWTFSKLIASSDEYFKHNDWIAGGGYNIKITPEIYETAARRKFYANAASTVASLLGTFWSSDCDTFVDLNNSGTAPAYITNFIPSTGYLISTIFDQLPSQAGGLSSSTWISRTNLNKGVGSDKYAEEVGIFWGPVLVEGYTSIVKKIATDNPASAANVYFKTDALSETPWTALKTIEGTFAYTPTKYDFPAECTTKILDIRYIYLNFNNLGNKDNHLLCIPPAIKTPYYESKKVSNNKVQFIPLSANLVGANDDNATTAFRSYERNFKIRMTEFFTQRGYNSPNNTMWGGMASRSPIPTRCANSTSAYKRSQCSFASSDYNFLAPTSIFPKYDCYICRDPNDVPVGYPEDMFNDAGSAQGGNCVGIICGRNTLSKSGGGNINFTVTSNFGFEPFSSVSQGNFFLGILPVGTTFIPLLTSNEVRQSRGKPQYGASQDDIYSFGTTVLAARVFDAWPESLTLFDPRYFAVAHFNPGEIGTSPKQIPVKILKTVGTTTTEVTMQIDKPDSSVDFRIPTDIDNNILAVGTIVKKDTKLLPKDYWRINPIRRGMMLTGGGFKYPKRFIGANTLTIKRGGKKYVAGNIISLSNNLKVKIKTTGTDGAITEIEIYVDDDKVKWAGDFTSGDFETDITFPPPKDNDNKVIPGYEAAVITLVDGKVYSVVNIDKAPVEHVPLQTISSSSNAGKNAVVEEVKTTTITLPKNSSGQYDVFTHFHNDITHTLLYHSLYGRTSLQHITMDVS